MSLHSPSLKFSTVNLNFLTWLIDLISKDSLSSLSCTYQGYFLARKRLSFQTRNLQSNLSTVQLYLHKVDDDGNDNDEKRSKDNTNHNPLPVVIGCIG